MHRVARLAPTLVAAASIGLLAGATTTPTAAGPSAPDQVPAVTTYVRVDTWRDRPWALTPGRYGDVADVSSGPDGRRFVLDAFHEAVHVLDADGTPRSVWRIPDLGQDVSPSRLDVGADGALRILSTSCERCRPSARLDVTSADGTPDWAIFTAERYVDVGVHPDGRIYLARAAESDVHGPSAVDVLDAGGQFLETVKPPEMDTPIRLDVARDGTVYVLHEIVIPPTPNPGGGGPRPPPGPSAWGAVDGPRQAPAPVAGVIILAPDHTYVETVPFEFGIDVAVGPAGVFVARYGQVFALREPEPITPLRGQRWTGRVSLDVPPGGGVLGGLSHCHFQGLVAFPEPAVRPAPHALAGALDRPPLEGPVYPLRVAAGASATVLQGRFSISGARPGVEYRTRATEPQSAQHWTLAGDLAGQMGVCGRAQEAGWAWDVAQDGGATFTMDASCVTRRPDDAFPEWTACLDGLWDGDVVTRLGAMDADGGRIAVLDVGGGGVVVLDASGAIVAHWPIAPDGAGAAAGPVAPPSDIALFGDRIYLAEQGLARIDVRGLDGHRIAAWPTLDSPIAASVGPDGDVFVLGRGGWAFRHAPDGALKAQWSVPDRTLQARDIAVADDGRVLVPYTDIDRTSGGTIAEIVQAGVWVFEPRAVPPPEPVPGPGACAARPDKRAAPGRIPLGRTVDVTLEVEGTCPATATPVQIAIVFDTSRSMSWGYAMEAAQRSVLQTLTRLDARSVEVALVTFADAPTLALPLSRDLVAVARHVSALVGMGDTQMAGGIELAVRNLTGPARDPAARPMLLIVTDANPKDQTLAALEAARAAGIDLAALVFQGGQEADEAFVSLFEGQGGRILFDPPSWALADFADALVQARPQDGLFETVTVVDRIPANMRYVPGSARPAAVFDAPANTLTWALRGVPAAPTLRLTYRLEPLEVGTWPTNVEAAADYRDATGAVGRLVFPVPEVTVYAPERFAAYLPLALREACVRQARPVDVVLVIDASVSMADPAAAGAAGTKLDAARTAARAFVRLLGLPADRVGVVAFNETARRLTGLTGDLAGVDAALDRLSPEPGTRIDAGLAEARRVLAADGRAGAQSAIVVLTDGLQNGPLPPVLDEAAAAKAAGAVVYAIGLGPDVDDGLMRAVASSPAHFIPSPTAADLAAIYARVSTRLVCGGG